MKLTTYFTKQQMLREEGTQEQKTFQTQHGYCRYKNTAVLNTIPKQKIKPKRLDISNRVCSSHEDKLQKITEIAYGGKVIIIKDIYEFTEKEDQYPAHHNYVTHHDEPHKKTMFFKKTLIKEGGKDLLKRNTKNLVKNFCKGFISYLERIKNQIDPDFIDLKKDFLFDKVHYNNGLIKKIVTDPDFSPIFYDFLKNHAEDWIRNSKIKDLQIHYEAIDVYLSLYGRKKKKDEFERINQRNPIDAQNQTFQIDNSETHEKMISRKIENGSSHSVNNIDLEEKEYNDNHDQ